MKLQGKHVVITGGTDGIGAASALAFCKEGAHVIIIGRNPDKGKALLEQQAAASSSSSDQAESSSMEFIQADFSSIQMAQKAARDVLEKLRNKQTPAAVVDVLLHCVGTLLMHTEHTQEGIEKNFCISYLCRVAFTEELFSQDSIKSSSTIMMNVANGEPQIASGQQFEYDDLQEVEARVGITSHHQAQTGNDLYVVLACERYKMYQTIGYSPGFVRTNVLREVPTIVSWLLATFASPWTRTPSQVAQQFISILDTIDENNNNDNDEKVMFYNKNGKYPIPEFLKNDKRQKDLIAASLKLIDKALSTAAAASTSESSS